MTGFMDATPSFAFDYGTESCARPSSRSTGETPVGPTGGTPVLLFRVRERGLFRGGFGERLVVRREIDRVDAVAFGIAVKKIAFAQLKFRFYSAQSLQFCCVSDAPFCQRRRRGWRWSSGCLFRSIWFFHGIADWLL